MQYNPCSNGYYELSLTLPAISKRAHPGHLILINQQFPFYILGNDPTIQVIIPQKFKEQYKPKTSPLIELQGSPLPLPDPTQFNLLIAENDGLSACLFYLRKYRRRFKGLVLIGTNHYFPFNPCPSRQILSNMPPDVIGALPLLEDWKIPNRLASLIEMPGLYQGRVKDLAKVYLEKSKQATVNTIIIPPLEAM